LREKGRKRFVRRRYHPSQVYRVPDLRIARKWLKRKVILTGEQHPAAAFRAVMPGNPARFPKCAQPGDRSRALTSIRIAGNPPGGPGKH
jgi:hypothetical protein